ncbi:MAG TPA: class I tRNA ligase family protein, partial [Gammaproteobacteria bacterium]|nr:class I tRNA ligase family protein [Gammaproteobacteria bacterium]
MRDKDKDYKDTLNLPKTDFPMRANLSTQEPKQLEKWQKTEIYQKIRQKRAGCEKYVLNAGPPYANGDIHIGHAVNKILKDIVIKAKNLSGYDAPFVPGWDCHGLPIELNVEKKIGKPGVDVDPKVFRQACKDYAKSQIALQKASFQRLGVFGDWENPYLTMDNAYQANIVRALGQILDKGYLHKGFKPVHWCIACGSALAEAEVEYKVKSSHEIDVCFPIQDLTSLQQKMSFNDFNQNFPKNVSVIIWTTTPWTLPANEAVALHPNLHYALVHAFFSGVPKWLILAEEMLPSCMERYGCTHYEVLGSVLGKDLEHLKLHHPFYEDKIVPIVLGLHVTTETGTGA